MTEEDARQLAESWIAAWNRHDLDAIVAHYSKKVVLTSPLVIRRLSLPHGTLRGHKALREYFDIGLRSVSDLRFELRHVLAGLDGLTVIYARENGALAADVMTVSPKGKVRRAHAFYHGLPDLPPD